MSIGKSAVLHPEAVEVGRLEDEEQPAVLGQRRAEHEAHRPVLVVGHHLDLEHLARGERQGDDGGAAEGGDAGMASVRAAAQA